MQQSMQRSNQNQSNSRQIVSQKQWAADIQEKLTTALTDHISALPVGLNRERFILNSIAVINSKAEDLRSVNPASIVQCLAKGAYLGLDFLNGECYAIPYKGELSFQTDYKGEIKLAKKYSRKRIADIYAKNVRKGDEFEEIIKDGHQSINFRPVPFSDEEIIGTFAVVLYEDGSMIYDTMSSSEIEKVRATYSKAQNSLAWRNSPGEMYKKTVLRRLLKLVDLEFDSSEQVEAFSAGSGLEFDQPGEERGPARPGTVNDTVIDVFAEEITDTEIDS